MSQEDHIVTGEINSQPKEVISLVLPHIFFMLFYIYVIATYL